MRKNVSLSITGFVLALLTVAYQLPQSVAHSSPVASPAAAAKPTIQAKIIKPKKAAVAPKMVASVTPVVTTHTYLPIVEQSGANEEQKKIADEMLRLLPDSCIAKLKNFYVKYGANMQSRGYAGASTVILSGDVKNADEFRLLVAHEVLGHFNELGCLTGNPSSGISAFKDGDTVMYNDDPSVAYYAISWSSVGQKKKSTTNADFASGYAPTDPFEDLAESVASVVGNPEGMHERGKTNAAIAAKVAWVETYVLKGRTLAKGTGSTKIPWDATKAAYTWLGGAVTIAAN